MSEQQTGSIDEPSEELKQELSLLILDHTTPDREGSQFAHPDGRVFHVYRPTVFQDSAEYLSDDIVDKSERSYHVYVEEQVKKNDGEMAALAMGYEYDPLDGRTTKADQDFKSLEGYVQDKLQQYAGLGMTPTLSGSELRDLIDGLKEAISFTKPTE